MPPKDAPLVLSWSRQDIESRLGFRGGRFTGVNTLCAFLGGACLSFAIYLLMVFALAPTAAGHVVAILFLRPGNLLTVIPGTLLFCWGVTILAIKRSKVKLQRRALDLATLPDNPDFLLTATTAEQVLSRLHSAVDHPHHFILLNRIERALANLKNIGQVSDVSSILRAQAENDEDQVASSYTLINGFVWAIPVLGFIGTVQGLSYAIGKFGITLQAQGDMSAIRASLQGVTSGLATAFETTLVALVFALILQLWITFQQKGEMGFLDECNDYCHARVVSRLRVVGAQNPPA
jgi:biopolymer transport protein ExbB/TolQ